MRSSFDSPRRWASSAGVTDQGPVRVHYGLGGGRRARGVDDGQGVGGGHLGLRRGANDAAGGGGRAHDQVGGRSASTWTQRRKGASSSWRSAGLWASPAKPASRRVVRLSLPNRTRPSRSAWRSVWRTIRASSARGRTSRGGR